MDDDGVACEHAVLVLSDIGIKADGCMDPAEALGRMDEQRKAGSPYDLVMTDYRMPEIDGIELTKRIREADDEVMIIILSGYSVDDVTDQVWEVGADGLLSKPLFTDTLTREIVSVLRKRAAGDEGVVVEEAEEESDLAVLVGRRVLLAEDVEINAEIMMDILDMEDVIAEHAGNGQIAVDMFAGSAEGYYDAVLMDVRMPVMDGLAATAAIRKLDRADAKRVPVIALTANAFDEDVQRSLQAGMDAHLSKPVEPDRLFDTLARLISEKGED